MHSRSADRRSASREANPIGFALAEARVGARMTIGQVSTATKVRAGLIKEIEYGQFESCGGDVYARGHIRSIAMAVGLDPAPLVKVFEQLNGVPEEAPVPTTMLASDPVALKEFKEHRGTRWMVPASVAMAVLGVVAGVGLLTGPGNQPAGQPLAQSQDAPSTEAITPTSAASLPSSKATTSTQPQNLLAYSGIVLQMRIKTQRSWVHVEDSTHRTLFEGVLNPGATKEFHTSGLIRGVLGNAGAVDLTVNGHHLGAPDGFGKIFPFSFSPGDPAISGNG